MVLVIEIEEIFIFEILINGSEQVQDRTRALNRHWMESLKGNEQQLEFKG